MKATTLLKNDHAAVKKLLADFGRTTARAAKKRKALMDRIAQELEIHSTIEEEEMAARKRALATSTLHKAKRAVKKVLRKTA